LSASTDGNRPAVELVMIGNEGNGRFLDLTIYLDRCAPF
jgi:hypothetical protein